MADQRHGGISWTDETWNPIRGCSRLSEGCRNCYAERVAGSRMSGPGQAYHGLAVLTPSGPRWTGKVALIEDLLDQPLRWKRPRLVFVNSMSDLFHESLTNDQIDQVVARMAVAGWHRFQVLTKRVRRMRDYLIDPATRRRLAALAYGMNPLVGTALMPGATLHGVNVEGWPLPNVWWGASAEDQDSYDDRIGYLLACRPAAAVLWLSLEPLIGPIETWGWGLAANRPDWVVVGGESGPAARPMAADWARRLRNDCQAHGVPFHFKQWGEWTPGENVTKRIGLVPACSWSGDSWVYSQEDLARDDGHVDDEPDLYRVGKPAAGRMLDGEIWDEYPAVLGEGAMA